MMNKDLAKAALFALAASFLTSQPAQAVPLHEALAVAYQNNSELKAQRERLKALDESLPQAYAGWLPSLSADYNRGRSNQRFGSADEVQINPTQYTLSMRQPVFNGGQTVYSSSQALNRIKAGREQLKRTEQKVLDEAVAAYVNLVRAREVLDLSKHNEKVLSEQLEATKSRFSLGETTKTDVAQSESRRARAESDRITAEGNLTAAAAEYKRVYEADPSGGMLIPDKLPGAPADFNAALRRAMENHPEFKRAEYELGAAKDGIGAAKSALFPDVELRGEVDRQEHRSSFASPSFEEESVTMNVSVPLYQSGAEYSRIRQAKNAEEAARLDLSSARQSVVNSITTAWKDIETSRANIAATETSVKSAELALQGVRQEQEIGSRTVLDVLDAEQELFTAKVNLVTARRNAVLAAYRLKSAMGELTGGALELKTDLYDPELHFNEVKYKFIGF